MEYERRLVSLLCALGLLAGALAKAQETPAATAAPPEKPATQEQPAAAAAPSAPREQAVKSASRQKQEQRKPPPRRAVQQAVGPEPTVNLGSPPTYGPTLTPRPPATPGPVGPSPAPATPAPATINSCAGSRCTDASGSQYNIGTGNAGVNSQGKLCNRVGTTVQCF
jgi:hypothetical protein